MIVGNDHYTDITDLSGAIQDARMMEAYVLKTLRVESGRILTIFDATRNDLLHHLSEHFAQANRGDTLLFFYAGHGASYPLYNTGITGGAAIEAICPSNRGPKSDGSVIQDISDRELNAIFSTISHRVGPNITVILDCCHAGGMQRQMTSRFTREDNDEDVASRRAPPIQHGLKEMLTIAMENKRIEFEGYMGLSPLDPNWTADRASHVLIAAAQDFERSIEAEKHGLFTHRLLEVIQDFPRKNINYYAILQNFGSFTKPNIQHPTILGDNIDSFFLQIGNEG